MSKIISRRKRSFIMAVVAVFMLAGTGVAFAFWTSTGSGSGTATTGQSVSFTITSGVAAGTIAPGGAGQTVEFTVTNPGPGIQNLSAVTVTMASPTGTPWVPTGDCSIADYSAVVTTPPTFGAVPVNGTRVGTATVSLANSDTNQDACQGQTVPLRFQAS